MNVIRSKHTRESLQDLGGHAVQIKAEDKDRACGGHARKMFNTEDAEENGEWGACRGVELRRTTDGADDADDGKRSDA